MSRAYRSLSSSTVSWGTTSSFACPTNSRESIMPVCLYLGCWGALRGLARVVLDDDVFVEKVGFALGHGGRREHAAAHRGDIEAEPGRCVLGFDGLLDDLVVLAADAPRRESDDVALLE